MQSSIERRRLERAMRALEPVMMIFFAVVLVGETLAPLQWVGVVIVISCLSLSAVFSHTKDPVKNRP